MSCNRTSNVVSRMAGRVSGGINRLSSKQAFVAGAASGAAITGLGAVLVAQHRRLAAAFRNRRPSPTAVIPKPKIALQPVPGLGSPPPAKPALQPVPGLDGLPPAKPALQPVPGLSGLPPAKPGLQPVPGLGGSPAAKPAPQPVPGLADTPPLQAGQRQADQG